MIPGFAPDHPSWLRLRDALEARIERSRDALEQVGMDDAATQFQRGQIAALRLLIRDVEEPAEEPITTPGYD